MDKNYKHLIMGLLGGLAGATVSNIMGETTSVWLMILVAAIVGAIVGVTLDRVIPEKKS